MATIIPTSATISVPTTRAIPSIVTEREFRDSPFGQQIESTEARVLDVLVAAESMIRKRINSSLVAADYLEVFPSVPSGRIFLTRRPVQRIYSIRYSRPYTAWADLSPLYYTLTSSQLLINPDYRSVVGYDIEVYYRAGFEKDEFPADLKYAIFAQAALLIAPDFELFGSGDSKAPGFSYLEKRIEEIVSLYRVGGIW